MLSRAETETLAAKLAGGSKREKTLGEAVRQRLPSHHRTDICPTILKGFSDACETTLANHDRAGLMPVETPTVTTTASRRPAKNRAAPKKSTEGSRRSSRRVSTADMDEGEAPPSPRSSPDMKKAALEPTAAEDGSAVDSSDAAADATADGAVAGSPAAGGSAADDSAAAGAAEAAPACVGESAGSEEIPESAMTEATVYYNRFARDAVDRNSGIFNKFVSGQQQAAFFLRLSLRFHGADGVVFPADRSLTNAGVRRRTSESTTGRSGRCVSARWHRCRLFRARLRWTLRRRCCSGRRRRFWVMRDPLISYESCGSVLRFIDSR